MPSQVVASRGEPWRGLAGPTRRPSRANARGTSPKAPESSSTRRWRRDSRVCPRGKRARMRNGRSGDRNRTVRTTRRGGERAARDALDAKCEARGGDEGLDPEGSATAAACRARDAQGGHRRGGEGGARAEGGRGRRGGPLAPPVVKAAAAYQQRGGEDDEEVRKRGGEVEVTQSPEVR